MSCPGSLKGQPGMRMSQGCSVERASSVPLAPVPEPRDTGGAWRRRPARVGVGGQEDRQVDGYRDGISGTSAGLLVARHPWKQPEPVDSAARISLSVSRGW